MTIYISSVQVVSESPHIATLPIYLGRPMRKYAEQHEMRLREHGLYEQVRIGSPLANPFKVRECADPIGTYRQWLHKQIKYGNQRVLAALQHVVTRVVHSRDSIVLVCWCARETRRPYEHAHRRAETDRCHCDCVAACVEWWIARGSRHLLDVARCLPEG